MTTENVGKRGGEGVSKGGEREGKRGREGGGEERGRGGEGEERGRGGEGEEYRLKCHDRW